MKTKVVSLRENPERLEAFIAYFARHWHNEALYRDCMTACLGSPSPLPQWYLLFNEAGETLGGAGLVTNDFNARMDLWPWLCALYIEDAWRGRALGSVLIASLKSETARLGFESLFLCTKHSGYYEKYGFNYLCMTHELSGGMARVYKATL